MIQSLLCQPNNPMMGSTKVSANIFSQTVGATMAGPPQAKLTDSNGTSTPPVNMNSTGGNNYVAIIGSGGLVAPTTASVTVQWQVMNIVSETAGCNC